MIGERRIGNNADNAWASFRYRWLTHNRSFNPPFPLPNFGRLFIVANDRLATGHPLTNVVIWGERTVRSS